MFVGYWPVGFPHFLPTTAVIPKGVSSSKKTSKHVRLLIVIRLLSRWLQPSFFGGGGLAVIVVAPFVST